MISQDFPDFVQISLCLKLVTNSHQGKKEVTCIVSKLLVSCLWGCGESVNPPKLNIQEVQVALSSRAKGDPGPWPIYFPRSFYFCQITSLKTSSAFRKIARVSLIGCCLRVAHTCAALLSVRVHAVCAICMNRYKGPSFACEWGRPFSLWHHMHKGRFYFSWLDRPALCMIFFLLLPWSAWLAVLLAPAGAMMNLYQNMWVKEYIINIIYSTSTKQMQPKIQSKANGKKYPRQMRAQKYTQSRTPLWCIPLLPVPRLYRNLGVIPG